MTRQKGLNVFFPISTKTLHTTLFKHQRHNKQRDYAIFFYDYTKTKEKTLSKFQICTIKKFFQSFSRDTAEVAWEVNFSDCQQNYFYQMMILVGCFLQETFLIAYQIE